MDLVAYFFRRCYELQRLRGTLGLISTNSISQGDTRKGGLSYICNSGGTVFSATRRLRWPGQAAVIVAVVHLSKGLHAAKTVLDGIEVDQITAFLFHRGGNDDPKQLRANEKVAFNGVYILGMGFTFDDAKENATSISEMNRILEANPKAVERIRAYIGGEEVNDSPTHSPIRYVINLSGLSEEEARQQYPYLMTILEEKVKPERLQKAADVAAFPWWRFWRERAEMQNAIEKLDRFLVCARHQPNWALAFLPPGVTPSDALVVFAIDDYARFAQMQSRTHEVWAKFLGSSIKDDLRYTPTDCFETFPFARSEFDLLDVSNAGQVYYDFRISLMSRNDEGFTATYNRFHSPHDGDTGIAELRRLHSAMDVAVLRAYGWNDLADQASQPDFCQFLLDYEEDEDDAASQSSTRQKKKPWRYRWPDDFRDEVLARLLELNEQRHKEELLIATGKSAEAKPAKEPRKKPAKATPLLDGLDQVELDRDERLILLIVDSFNLITRTAVNEAFIAMKYPKLRKSRLGLGDPPKSVPRTDAGRDALIGGLVDRGFLAKHPSDHQQIGNSVQSPRHSRPPQPNAKL